MKKIRPIVQILVGTLLVILVVNDFFALLIEYLTNVSDLKLPIEWSKEGWKLKFWMIDHPPVFAIYQAMFMGTGFLMIFSALFDWLPSKVNLGISAGLVLSALLVLMFPKLHYITQETPKPFMWAQLVSGTLLLLAAIKTLNNQHLQRFSILTSAVLCTMLLIATLIHSPVTLLYGVFPIAGTIYLVLTQNKISK